MLKGLVTEESVKALERRLDALERGRVRWTDPPFALQQQSDGTAIRLTQNFPKLVQVTEVSGTSYSFEEIWYPPNGTPTKLIGGVSGYRNGKSVNGVPLVVGAQVLLLDSTQGLDSYALLQPGESNPYYPGEDCCDECRTVRKIILNSCLYYDPDDPTTLLGIQQQYQIICFPSGEVLYEGCETVTDCGELYCGGTPYPGFCCDIDDLTSRGAPVAYLTNWACAAVPSTAITGSAWTDAGIAGSCSAGDVGSLFGQVYDISSSAVFPPTIPATYTHKACVNIFTICCKATDPRVLNVTLFHYCFQTTNTSATMSEADILAIATINGGSGTGYCSIYSAGAVLAPICSEGYDETGALTFSITNPPCVGFDDPCCCYDAGGTTGDIRVTLGAA